MPKIFSRGNKDSIAKKKKLLFSSFLKCQWMMVFFPDLHFHSYISKKDVQFWFLNGFERIHYYNYEIMTPHEELNLRNSVALASTRRKKNSPPLPS